MAKAIAAALLPQLEEVLMSCPPPVLGPTDSDENNKRLADGLARHVKSNMQPNISQRHSS